ncbi:MAG: hypothetical protein AB8G99_05355 [Planctomycetaceae bacterium]
MDTTNPYQTPVEADDSADPAEFHWTQLFAPGTFVGCTTALTWIALLTFVGPPLSRWPFSLPTAMAVPCLAAIASTRFFGRSCDGKRWMYLPAVHFAAIALTPIAVVFCYDQITSRGVGLRRDECLFLAAIGLGCGIADLLFGLWLFARNRHKTNSSEAGTSGS